MKSKEYKKGDHVVSTWGLEKRVLKIALKPKLKSGVLYITLLIDGVRRECLAQWWRHATPEEIAAGHRIDNDMGDNSHIENHISNNCKVIDYD